MKKRSKHAPYKKRKSIFTIFSSKLFFFLLIIIFSGIVKISFDKIKEWHWAKNTLTAQEEKIEKEEQRKGDLRSKLDYLQREGDLIRIIKEKLNLVSPGEKVIFVMPEEKEKEETQGEKKEVENKNLFEKFIQFFEETFLKDKK